MQTALQDAQVSGAGRPKLLLNPDLPRLARGASRRLAAASGSKLKAMQARASP